MAIPRDHLNYAIRQLTSLSVLTVDKDLAAKLLDDPDDLRSDDRAAFVFELVRFLLDDRLVSFKELTMLQFVYSVLKVVP